MKTPITVQIEIEDHETSLRLYEGYNTNSPQMVINTLEEVIRKLKNHRMLNKE